MKILLSLLIMICSTALTAQMTYPHCGSILDCIGSEAAKQKTFIIEDDKIISRADGHLTPSENTSAIDLNDQTVMPGFMDMHVHVEGQSSPKKYEDGFRMNESYIALKAISTWGEPSWGSPLSKT